MIDILKSITGIDKNLVLICTSNERYIKPTRAFLNSIIKNSPKVNVLVRLVNVKQDTITGLKATYNDYNIYFYIDNTPLCDKRNIVNKTETFDKSAIQLMRKSTADFKGVGWLYSEEAAYCSNIKYNTINQLLEYGIKCVVYMDVDTIVRKDIYNIQDTINTYDLAMYICPNEHLKTSTQYGEKYIGWHAGIIISNNTMLSVDFLKDVEKRVSNNMYDIEADEDEFDHVFYQKKYNNKIKINSLTKYYKDNGPEFNVKNAVWSGQNVAKVDNKKYINEYSKYI
tara:strand:+ start:4911 stop:5759 length:849 start_codon:yes stop_codon:yes gene_type:complete